MNETLLVVLVIAVIGLVFTFAIWRTVRKRNMSCCDDPGVPAKVFKDRKAGKQETLN